MSLVFIGIPQETFTPTRSGALATIAWEICRVALTQGVEPWVLFRGCEDAPFPWPNFLPVPPPKEPESGLPLFLARADRKVFGWTHIGGREFARSIIKLLAEKKLYRLPLVVFNDPDLVVLLRKAFPKARIFHWFQNQLTTKPKTRKQFRGSVDACFAVSNFTSRWIENFYSYQHNEVKTLYNAVDTSLFCPAPAPHSGIPIINFVGRTGVEKAPDLLLKACLQLSEKTTNFALQIVGSNHWHKFELDEYQTEIMTLTGELEKRGITVHRPGHVGRAALPAMIQRAHIHVVPSRWDEPFGLTTLEGMACGLATIGSATGGTPEVIGDAGLLFERESISGLATHLELLVQDEAARLDYGRRGRERAVQFSWSRCWQQLNNLVSAEASGS